MYLGLLPVFCLRLDSLTNGECCILYAKSERMPAIILCLLQRFTAWYEPYLNARPGERQRAVIDPQPVQTPVTSERPLLVVLYVGETARAADWGLADYKRRTTPQLRLRKASFSNQVTACGTSTDVSLPCMFSRIGRSDYDRDKILSQESMLSVIQRAGVSVRWVDNQSGCKGACTPKMLEPVVQNERDCSHGRCMDGAMLGNIKNAISRKISERRQLLVLHMMGSHGPAYWRRVPEGFAPFGAGMSEG